MTKQLALKPYTSWLLLAVIGMSLAVGESAMAQSDDSSTGGSDEGLGSGEGLSNLVAKSANRIDNFFSTEEHTWQDNKTRVTVRGNVDWVENHGTEFNPELKIKLILPGLDERLQLIVNDNDDDTTSGSAAQEDESNIALRFAAKSAARLGISFDLGLSTRGDPTLQGFARANLHRRWHLGTKWNARVNNRLYWYTDSKWRNDFKWYFERPFGKAKNWFFRSRTRFDYQQDKEDNWIPEQRFTVFQQINPRTALAYETIAQQIYFDDSVFDFPDEFIRTCELCTQYQVRLRFRQQIKSSRWFYELWPIAATTEIRDYEFTPAFRFRLELVLGEKPRSTKLEE